MQMRSRKVVARGWGRGTWGVVQQVQCPCQLSCCSARYCATHVNIWEEVEPQLKCSYHERQEGQQETFGGDGHVYYLGHSDGLMGVDP